MYDAPLVQQQLKEMRERIRRSVNLLEVCHLCERVCECEQRWVNDVLTWVCIECLSTEMSPLNTVGDSHLSSE